MYLSDDGPMRCVGDKVKTSSFHVEKCELWSWLQEELDLGGNFFYEFHGVKLNVASRKAIKGLMAIMKVSMCVKLYKNNLEEGHYCSMS